MNSEQSSSSETGSGVYLLLALSTFGVLLAVPSPPDLPPAAHRMGAIIVLMAVLWLTNALPMAITSLIPLVAFPLLGIEDSATVSKCYIDQNIFLYLGGFMLALGIERWGLHRRIALHIVARVGHAPRRIVLGFMLATAFLSMWISNTASTLLMMPIGLAMLTAGSNLAESSNAGISDDSELVEKMGLVLLLGIAYSASIGGLMTVVGTPTNVAFLGIWESQFSGGPDISAGQWMLTWIPAGLVMLAVTWLVLTWPLRGLSADRLPSPSSVRDRLRELGPASRPEKMMLTIFVITAMLWTFRKPLQFGSEPLLPGWQTWIESMLLNMGTDPVVAAKACHDSTVAIGMSILMFALPGQRDGTGRMHRLMDWSSMQQLPWAILLLIGGGFAIASGVSQTGLAAWAGSVLAGTLEGMPIWIMVGSICLLLTFLTEFTSNVATVTTLVPILSGAALQLGVDPRLIMVPAVVSASCAFMLPIATPPNAIIFSSGRIRIGQMARYGILLNLIGVIVVSVVSLVVMRPQWGIQLDRLPDWADSAAASSISD